MPFPSASGQGSLFPPIKVFSLMTLMNQSANVAIPLVPTIVDPPIITRQIGNITYSAGVFTVGDAGLYIATLKWNAQSGVVRNIMSELWTDTGSGMVIFPYSTQVVSTNNAIDAQAVTVLNGYLPAGAKIRIRSWASAAVNAVTNVPALASTPVPACFLNLMRVE